MTYDGRPEEGQSSGYPYIPSKLDDYGLPHVEFRVYCHILRRAGTKGGVCFESVPNMAAFLGLHHQTLRPSLKCLLMQGFIRAECRAGNSTCYYVNPPSSWAPPLRKNHRGESFEGDPSEKTIGHPSEKTVDKGSPKKGIPKGDPKTQTGDSAGSSPLCVWEVVYEAFLQGGVNLTDKDGKKRPKTELKKWCQNNDWNRPVCDLLEEHPKARSSLDKAFRFIRYNNKQGWSLKSWTKAFKGLCESDSAINYGISDVPLDWCPTIENAAEHEAEPAKPIPVIIPPKPRVVFPSLDEVRLFYQQEHGLGRNVARTCAVNLMKHLEESGSPDGWKELAKRPGLP